jgi:CBS domain-containing protein
MEHTIESIMTAEVVTARPSTPSHELVDLLQRKRISALLAVDQDGTLAPGISLATSARLRMHGHIKVGRCLSFRAPQTLNVVCSAKDHRRIDFEHLPSPKPPLPSSLLLGVWVTTMSLIVRTCGVDAVTADAHTAELTSCELAAMVGVGPAAERLIRRIMDATVMPVWSSVRNGFIKAMEHRYRIRTRGFITPEELGIAHPDRVEYDPTPWFGLRQTLPVGWVRSDDVFIDFGAGMGRVVFQAAAYYPFKRVIGIELSRALHEIAQANIERSRDRLRCRNIELVNCDVASYEIPDDVTVVYLFNPFTGQTFSLVIDRLLASVARNPRSVRIVYRNPREHGRLMGTGQIRLVKRIRRLRPGPEWTRSASTYVYEVPPWPQSGPDLP